MGMKSRMAKLNIQQGRGELEIKTTPSKMNIVKDKLEIRIDQTQCFAEAGLKTNTMLMDEYADLGRQYAMEGIARIAEEGNQLAMPNNTNAIANIAANKTNKVLDFNIKFIPESKPIIDFVGGDLKINWDIGKVDMKYTPQKPKIEYVPGELDIYVEQYPSIKIDFIDEKA